VAAFFLLIKPKGQHKGAALISACLKTGGPKPSALILKGGKIDHGRSEPPAYLMRQNIEMWLHHPPSR